ncbi:DNA excision repair protein ERCC-5 [Panulirus ornatus]|uniref:DNA excision repair protein ERCC-5 n=1 Tax=Panulirus ornatus TaxID=150431 RepID=UPI003A8AB1A9
MGVKGLWKLIENAGVPVPLETLEHKILTVDVSIWLHQAVRGFRGPGGATVANAHLLTLFHRICKLLFYRIRPVFVFDGGVPHLKKQTLASRRLRRDIAASRAKVVRERLLQNLLKSQAVRRALGKTGPAPSLAHVSRVQKREKDMFELPPLPETENSDSLASQKSEDSEDEDKYILRNLKLPNLHNFEFESDEFKSLAVETQHEILSELQDTRKQNSWNSINEMPQESENFAEFQMGRLIKRRNFQATLDSTREEIQKIKVAEMESEMFGELEKHVTLSQRIISEDAAHSILVKKVKDSDEKIEENKIIVKEDKGKSPLKRKREVFEKDFLTELAKQGIVGARHHSDSDSDSEGSLFQYGNMDEGNICANEKKRQNPAQVEEESFLEVVGTLMENSGLTQDEILALIKQENNKQDQLKNESGSEDGPSTSENASGFVFNPDADSSDDDGDFVEVSETSDQCLPQPLIQEDAEDASKEHVEANNVDKLLKTKTDSLWMKIVQQKLDDMVHTNVLKPSPKKAILDSRKLGFKDVKKENKKLSGEEVLKPVKISLDFEVKPLKMEDDIFADIFTDINYCGLASKSVLTPKKNFCEKSSEKQQMKQGNLNSTESNNKDDMKPENDNQAHNIAVNLAKSGNSNETLTACKSGIKAKVDNTPTDGHKSIKVDEALQNKINELVKVQVEKFVNSASEENEPGLNKVHKIEEKQDPDVVEIMSSSDDSDSDEFFTSKCEPGSSKTRTIAPIADPSPASHSSDSDANENDFTEMKENNSYLTGTDADCTVNRGNSDLHHEDNKSLESDMEQQLNYCNFPKVKEMQNGDFATEREIVKEMLNTESSETVAIEEIKELIDTEGGEGPSISQELERSNSRAFEHQERDLPEDAAESESIEDVERPVDFTEDELKRLEGELATEQQTLVAQAQKTDRIAANLNDQMYGEAQQLLQLFGIPYLVAPMEAEAQCAFLDAENLSSGTITDDSDIFLFGGTRVYKNFFNQTKHVEFFKIENIRGNFGLDRQKMITLALLTGSDYTEGVESVGNVAAMEVLAEFPGEGIECLRNLKKWWTSAHRNVSSLYTSKVKQKMRQVMLMDSFPNEKVYEAYMSPEVDESKEKFTWAVPNVDALRAFTSEKFGWNSSKADEILTPVMKKLGIKTSQTRIDSFFTNIKLVKESKITSKRVQDAIAKTKGEKPPSAEVSSLKNKRKYLSNNRSQKKKRKVEDLDNSDGTDDSKHSCMEDVPSASGKSTSSNSSRTKLIDPSESSSCVSKPSKPRRTGKTKSQNMKATPQKNSQDLEAKSSQLSSAMGDIDDDQPPRKLTKEIMYKALLEKEIISQRESDKKKMEEKKLAAAQILKKQLELRRAHRR